MGCTISKTKAQPDKIDRLRSPEIRKAESGLKLVSCKVDVSNQQLLRINRKFASLLELNNSSRNLDSIREQQIGKLSVVIERLVQRLVAAAGELDARFASKYLISLNAPDSKTSSTRLKYKYLIRLDSLSTPALYQGQEPPVRILQGTGRDTLPAGYTRIRVLGEYLETWADLSNQHGYLRRDKIQERFMEILATAAGRPGYPTSPLDVDESRFCGAPGKIFDPLTLHHIMQRPSIGLCFYGPAESDEARFPDPRDFRIAIVEGVPEVRLHVSFLSPTAQTLAAEEDVEIVLTLCVGVADWPQQSDYPLRLPLDHTDSLLSLKAAQTGYFLVPCGPHHTVRCDDRTSVWEIRTPAADTLLEQHYSQTSVVSRCKRTLRILMDFLRSRGVKTLNSYILKTLLWWELERKPRLDDWTPGLLSKRILSILDTLALCLRQQHLRSYIFQSVNLLLQPFVAEEDYRSDAEIVEAYINQLLQDRGGIEGIDSENSVQDHLDTAMLLKWNHVIGNLTPANSIKSRRINRNASSTRYSRRQMEYVAFLFRETLKLHHIQQKPTLCWSENRKPPADHLEDFFFLLQNVFEQAKSMAWTHSPGESKRHLREILDAYDISVAMTIDTLKRDDNLAKTFNTDMQLVAKIIECLYTALDSDSKVLGPVLKPYMDQLFRGSLENCWFLQEWLQRHDNSEFDAIEAFSKLVLTEGLDPLQGLLDCVAKGWRWAKHALHMLKAVTDKHSADVLIGHRADSPTSGLRLIFTPSMYQTVRCTLRLTDAQSLELTEYLREEQLGRTPLSTLKRGRKVDSRYGTVRSFPETIFSDNRDFTCSRNVDTWWKLQSLSDKLPVHGKLRDGSPLTIVSLDSRRNGSHRGIGSIVQALISLQKLTVLQEISVHLPDDERCRVLGDIQKLSKEVQRISLNRRRSDEALGGRTRFSFKRTPKRIKNEKLNNRRSSTLPNAAKQKKAEVQKSQEVYRSLNEFLHEKTDIDEEKQLEETVKRLNEDSLLGTCRVLRNQHVQEKLDFGTLFVPHSYGRHSGFRPMDSIILQKPFHLKATSSATIMRPPEMTEI